MPTIDLSQLPAPEVIESLDYETLLNERKATLISLYPQDEQEAVARVLSLESDPIVKLLQEKGINRRQKVRPYSTLSVSCWESVKMTVSLLKALLSTISPVNVVPATVKRP